jgi:uncharacterized membrane protein
MTWVPSEGVLASSSWINDRGDVIGTSSLAGKFAILGFLWGHGVLTNLGTVDGDLCSFRLSINLRGQIVGLWNNCQGYQGAALMPFYGRPADLEHPGSSQL